MSARIFIYIFAALIALLILINSVFIVKETQRAIILRFGELIETDVPPGLHFKVPFFHTVKKFEGRVLTLDSRPARYLTVEKKPLIVDSYVKWKIDEVGEFYTATSGDEAVATKLLSSRVDTGLRNKFGVRTLHEVVSGERDQLMNEMTLELDEISRQELGIRIIDVRVKGVELPDDVSDSVYGRMSSEREKEAREHRSKGKELAEGIMAFADRQKVEIEAEAYRESERIRGEGDAEATAIYARAYNQDPELYAFTRSLKAYVESFKSKGDVLVLSPDSEFFKFLKDSDGKN